MNMPAPKPQALRIGPDWIATSGLTAEEQFPFIADVVGDGATLTRYRPVRDPATPAVAVDVIETANFADFADAIWYASSKPINYKPATMAATPVRVPTQTVTQQSHPGPQTCCADVGLAVA